MPKVLITGAMGFLGRQCTKAFLHEGFDVITTDKISGAEVIGDLTDSHFVSQLPAVDTVVNCAAVQYVTPRKPVFRKQFFYNNNVLSTKLLTEKYKETSHFIHVGTSMMYESGEQDLTEVTPLAGNGIYSQSKCEAQKFVLNIRNSSTVIPCIIGGVGREGLFRPFVNMIKSSPIALIPGDGIKPIHMVHVEDVASLIVLIAKKRCLGFYNAASPGPLSIREWIRIIAKTIGQEPPLVMSIPIELVSTLTALTGYRLLAREQLLMLKSRHVLCIEKSLKLGWRPMNSNLDISTQIAKYILAS